MKPVIRNTAMLALAAALAVGGWLAFGQSQQAPVVKVTRLDGQAMSTDALHGKVVFVNFWATTCTTCGKEMPQLVDTFRKYGPQGYETLAVAMDYDNPEWVKAYVARNELPFTVVQDKDGSAAKAFGDIRLTPTSFLIDRKGHIVQQYLGEPKWVELHARIEKLLADPA